MSAERQKRGAFPHKMTVYNKYTVEGQVHWKSTVLTGVMVQDGVQLADSYVGKFQGGTAVCYVPERVAFSNGYLSPEDFDELEDKSGHFTFRVGDYVVKGFAPTETQTNASPNDLMNANVPGIYEVVGAKHADYGRLRHFRLVLR